MTAPSQTLALPRTGGLLTAARRLFAPSRKGADAAAGTGIAYLHCSDIGWSALVLDPASPGAPTALSGEPPAKQAPAPGEERLDTVFAAAAEAFERNRVSIDRLHVLTDDPGIFYTDTRGEQFNAAEKTSPAVLRAYGAEQLNASHAIFGFAPFGQKGGKTRQNGVAAFASAKRAGGCLGRLDRLALKVGSLVPVADILVRRAHELGGATYGALYVGGQSSQLVVACPRHGTVTSRVLPVGIMTLVEAVARESGIGVEDAQRALGERSVADEVMTLEPLGDDAEITRSAMDRMIGPALRRMVADIEATLEFFDTQRVSDRPQRLELFGACDRVNGLADFLAASLPVEPSPVSVLELFQRQPPGDCINLLQHTGSDLQIGQTRYSLHGDRLAAAKKPERADSRAGAGRPGDRRKQPGRRGSRSRPAANQGLAGLLARLRGQPAGDGEEAPSSDRQYFLLFGLVCGLLLLVAWQSYDDLQSRHRNAMARVSQLMDENARIRRAVGGSERVQAAAPTDKVLWTEKFLAIGRNMDKPMWLTDVFLATETRTVGGSSVVSKKLVLEGAVLPSTVGHILEISKFIDRLEKDTVGFMDDFREIRFHGASLDQAESDPIIRFGIEAWYDENKRVQTRAATPAGGAGGGPLGDMQIKVRERNEAIETHAPVSAR
ncbi:hypothetical protein [Azospirillum sp. B2RO_4]|uniref:hypothetical protein n=1 Tax=Azospirillum sp. B2RO_4 TaxID=3027796 RepID=UPI003DA82CE3